MLKLSEDRGNSINSIPFLYITNPKTYYERQECFINVELPQFPKRKSVDLTPEEISLLKEYQCRFLLGVRQNSIRNSHTKNKAGTLPLFCYGHKDPDPQPVNFDSLLNEVEEPIKIMMIPKLNFTVLALFYSLRDLVAATLWLMFSLLNLIHLCSAT